MVPPSLYLHFATHKTQLSTFRFAFKKKKKLWCRFDPGLAHLPGVLKAVRLCLLCTFRWGAKEGSGDKSDSFKAVKHGQQEGQVFYFASH